MATFDPTAVTGMPPLLTAWSSRAYDAVPPFVFTGVTMRSFPLRANIRTLQSFVDSYLNILPPEVARFRVVAPYVNFMLLDYGKMDIAVRNVGWLAQREIVFNIPLAWYKVRDGEWIFHDWATLAPFIYVDDDMSMATGRAVYGWTKSGARLAPALSQWIRDVRAPVANATVITKVFPRLYTGAKIEERVFIEVRREAPVSILGAPFDSTNPLWPWNVASNVAGAWDEYRRAYPEMLTGAGVWPLHPSATPDNAMAMLGHAMESGFPLRPRVVSNPINLKQFRRSEHPTHFCYQAVTNGPMRIQSVNGGGLLGEDRLLLGDASGGYTIRIHEWPSLPIVETLGLEVAARQGGEGCDIVDLKPVVPSWSDLDMVYETGYNLAWRGRDGIWHARDGNDYPPVPEGPGSKTEFVTTLGAAQLAVPGPFTFSNTTVRVLPLLAERIALETFLDRYLNEALTRAGERFKLWGAADETPYGYVYLTVTTVGEVTSKSDSLGDWANYELAYLLPVRHERFVPSDTGAATHEGARGDWELAGIGMVPAVTMVDNARAAASSAEVLGMPAQRAFFVKPESAWMSDRGPRPETLQTVLRVVMEVADALDVGQELHYHRVLEIAEGNLPDDTEGLGWRLTADRWATLLREELERKKRVKRTAPEELQTALDVARGLLDNKLPLNIYTLKQFPDITDPVRACYQSLVRVDRSLREVLDLREIEKPLVVRIKEYPSTPIVSMLGLVAKQLPADGPGITYAVQPLRPFWLLATIDEGLGQPLLFRTGDEWVRPDSATPDASGAATAPAASVAAKLDPQAVIEALLSREWGNFGPDSRWKSARRELDAKLTSIGWPLSPSDRSTLLHMVELVRRRPGHWRREDEGLKELAASSDPLEALANAESAWYAAAGKPSDGSTDQERAALRAAIEGFSAALQRISREQMAVEPVAARIAADRRAADISLRLAELAEHTRGSTSMSNPEVEHIHREVTELLNVSRQLRREALLELIAREWQKPDYVVRRSSVGADQERLFPRAESWDDVWYAGPASTRRKPG